jgi:hypothetical protein
MDDYVDASALGPDDRFAIGQPLPSSEAPVLLRGDGHYSDDASLPSLCRDGAQEDPPVEFLALVAQLASRVQGAP